jgi:hypothetical protein
MSSQHAIEKLSCELNVPSDREDDINIAARQERDLTQAVMILESRLRDINPPLGGS